MSSLLIRKVVSQIEETRSVSGRADEGGPLRKVAVCAVVANPFAGQGYVADLSAIDFNSQYAKLAVDDHRAMLKLLDKVTSSTRDEELKALAEKLKPKVQAHLKLAMELTAGTPR